MNKKLSLIFTLFFCLIPFQSFGDKIATPKGLSKNEALLLGEKIYREGILPSGKPVEAIVQDDIVVEGTMFTCSSCHLRSGFGGYEGKVYTLSTNAEILFKPRLKGPERRLLPIEKLPKWFKYGEARPAYTDKSLAEAIRYGVDPTGRELSPTMPRYILEDRDMEILIYYLKNLNPKKSNGVDEYYISFATIVTEEVPKEHKKAMIDALQSIVKANNTQTRHQEKRAKKGPWTEENMNFYYRKFNLFVWTLKGQPDTWYNQLKKYYKKQPVFAILGGISTKSWEPIHKFCEDFKIPNVLPITDLPVISDKDWYTLYFSKGYYQEGELIAKYLNNLENGEENILIIYDNSDESKMLTKGFVERWKKYNRRADEIKVNDLSKIGVKNKNYSKILIFLPYEEFINTLKFFVNNQKISFFGSTTLLGEKFLQIPEDFKESVFLTYPYSIDRKDNNKLIESWMKFMKFQSTNKDIVAKIYTLGNILTDTLMMVKGNFYRDYFLDVIDMQRDRVPPFTNYERLSFGQGQRYASKGGYIVKIGKNGELIRQNEWIIF